VAVSFFANLHELHWINSSSFGFCLRVALLWNNKISEDGAVSYFRVIMIKDGGSVNL